MTPEEPHIIAGARAGRVAAVVIGPNRDRLDHYARRVVDAYDARTHMVVIVNVDAAHGQTFADEFMPGHDWAGYRARGETPFARGIQPRDRVQALLEHAARSGHPDAQIFATAARYLRIIPGVAALLIDAGMVFVFDVACLELGSTPRARFERAFAYCGQPIRVACDGRCEKAWGLDSRPWVSGPGPGEREYLADGELGDAPVDPGTREGPDAKPRSAASVLDMTRWCVRQCERCARTPIGDPTADLVLPDLTRRVSMSR